MRKYIFFFLVVSSLGFAQNLEVTYSAKYNGSSVSDAIKIAKEKNMSSAQLSGFKQYILKVKNDVESQKIKLTTLSEKDFVLKVPSEMKSDFDNIPNISLSYLNLYNLLYNKNNSVIGVNDSQDYAVLFNSESASWEITKETKEILGFKCFKAKLIFNTSYGLLPRLPIEVWFAPSINKRGGPIVYTNLPGLILEVVQKNSTITAVNIDNLDEVEKLVETEEKVITEFEAYDKLKKATQALQERMN